MSLAPWESDSRAASHRGYNGGDTNSTATNRDHFPSTSDYDPASNRVKFFHSPTPNIPEEWVTRFVGLAITVSKKSPGDFARVDLRNPWSPQSQKRGPQSPRLTLIFGRLG